MKIIRFTQKKKDPQYGWILEDHVGLLSAPPFGAYRRLDAVIPLNEVKLLSPVAPSKILAVGRNYPEHAREHEVDIPETPMIFMKPPSAVINPGQASCCLRNLSKWNMKGAGGGYRSARALDRLEDTANHILGYRRQ